MRAGGMGRQAAPPAAGRRVSLVTTVLLVVSGTTTTTTRRTTRRRLEVNPTSCLNGDGTACGDCGPGCEYCGAVFEDAPGYHLMDQHGCLENDPNGPVFDPVHGVAHHFYQAHLARPGGTGPVYGHFVSKDLVKWATLGVAIWNGLDASTNSTTAYDTRAIYTGSAAVVDGAGPNGSKGVVQIYPGLCDSNEWDECATGTGLAQAVPANYSDPLLEVWTKAKSANPIANDTQRDPSSPWKTPYGEWRLRTYDAVVYASTSDRDLIRGDWYKVGTASSLRQCECPSLYPLPALTPGFPVLIDDPALPTHVHKTSCSGDWWQLGNWVDGPPGVVGNFSAAPGWSDLFRQRKIDAGKFYASKDNTYPTLNAEDTRRRVNWGWAQVKPASTQTLPREITFNPRARVLEQKPLDELKQLRSSTVFNDTATLPAVFDLTSKQVEIILHVHIAHLLDGQTLNVSVARCADCLFQLVNASSSSSSGNVSLSVDCRGYRDTLTLLLDLEDNLQVRIFADVTFLEVYVQNGRVATTVDCLDFLDDDAAVAVSSDAGGGGASSASIQAFTLDSIWVDPQHVRDQPRLYF